MFKEPTSEPLDLTVVEKGYRRARPGLLAFGDACCCVIVACCSRTPRIPPNKR